MLFLYLILNLQYVERTYLVVPPLQSNPSRLVFVLLRAIFGRFLHKTTTELEILRSQGFQLYFFYYRGVIGLNFDATV